MKHVIVIGGGLAGLSAAHTVLENGGRVTVVDKMTFLGGNSTKATSGINGVPTKAQKAAKVEDTVEIFSKDITDSAGHLARPDLIKLLAEKSGSAVEWIGDAFGVDLSIVSRLGGHSQPRTHRGKEKFPGFAITYAMIEKYEEFCKSNPERAALINKAKVVRLLEENGVVVGIEYERNGALNKLFGAVVIATGGYAADYTADSLLKKFRPELLAMPTTNGEHCTGDGVKLASQIGAALFDMEQVQVHPTGLVFPKDPDAKVLFLAAEALRGCGAIMINRDGERFVDELGRRDYVSGEMAANKPPFRLVLNKKAAQEIEWHCKHYVGRGVMQRYESAAALAQDMGIQQEKLAETFRSYNVIRPDPFGRKFFSNLPYEMNDEYHVAIVTPVVHYTMGGVGVNDRAQILRDATKAPIVNLYAAGEVCGGVHGKNRLGGNSLLDCVVYGREAGKSALELYRPIPQVDGVAVGSVGGATRLATVIAHISPTQTVTVHIDLTGGLGGSASSGVPVSASAVPGGHPDAPEAAGPPGAPPPAAGANAGAKVGGAAAASRQITRAEVAKHITREDCWVIVNGKVLDVSEFLPDHPGGAQAILVFAGKDASEEFNMLHAKNVIDKYLPAEKVLGDLAD